MKSVSNWSVWLKKYSYFLFETVSFYYSVHHGNYGPFRFLRIGPFRFLSQHGFCNVSAPDSVRQYSRSRARVRADLPHKRRLAPGGSPAHWCSFLFFPPPASFSETFFSILFQQNNLFRWNIFSFLRLRLDPTEQILILIPIKLFSLTE